MAGRRQHGVDGVALGVGAVTPAHAELEFEAANHRLDR